MAVKAAPGRPSPPASPAAAAMEISSLKPKALRVGKSKGQAK